MGRKRESVAAKTFVLDCSLTVAWFFEDEMNRYAQAVEDSLAAAAVVPGLWPLEVANALLVRERRCRAWQHSLHLARSHRLSVYDAAYLELALRQGLPLATLDDRLAAAATSAGVPAYKPA